MTEDRYLSAVRQAHHLAKTWGDDYAITRQLRVLPFSAAKKARLSVLEVCRAPKDSV